jgi:hypothetical protein
MRETLNKRIMAVASTSKCREQDLIDGIEIEAQSKIITTTTTTTFFFFFFFFFLSS